MSARKVLITGANGYVGTNLVAALAGSCSLRCLVRKGQSFRESLGAFLPPAELKSIEVVEADVRDREAVRRACREMESVVHLAALTSDEDPSQFELLQVNLLGTEAVLEGAAAAGGLRVIFPSTYHVYGRLKSLPPGPVGEETPLKPASLYAASKAVGESLARSADVNEVIVRLPHLYGVGCGAGDWGGVLLRFIDQAVQDSAITLDAGAADVRDYLHISDTVACLRVLALAAGPLRGTFNAGSGQPVTLREMAQWIAEGIGRSKGRPVEVRGPAAAESPARAFLDTGKLRSQTGFAPAVAPRRGIEELLERLVPA